MAPKTTKIAAFHVDLPLQEGSYKWSGGSSVEIFDSTVVAIHTDQGVNGLRRIRHCTPSAAMATIELAFSSFFVHDLAMYSRNCSSASSTLPKPH